MKNDTKPDTETPTPRTDAVSFNAPYLDSTMRSNPRDVVDSNFARTLERELASAQSELARVTAQNEALAEEVTIRAEEATRVKGEIETIRPILSTLRFHANAICAISGRSEHDLTKIVADIIAERDKLRAEVATLKARLGYAEEEIAACPRCQESHAVENANIARDQALSDLATAHREREEAHDAVVRKSASMDLMEGELESLRADLTAANATIERLTSERDWHRDMSGVEAKDAMRLAGLLDAMTVERDSAIAKFAEVERERDRFNVEIQSVQKYIRAAIDDDVIDGCSPAECVAILTSQRENARAAEAEYKSRLANSERASEQMATALEAARPCVAVGYGGRDAELRINSALAAYSSTQPSS